MDRHITAPLERAGILADRIKALAKILAYKAQGEDDEAEELACVVQEAAEEIAGILDTEILKPKQSSG